jgi:drug/metabolite transporter (DMT)-like permease
MISNTSSHRFIGILLISISAAAFGTLALLGRYAFADGMDALTIMFFRFTLAAGLMFVLLIARKESLPRGAALYRLIGMGAMGYVGQAFSYLTALKYASSGLVALLLYLYPMFVAVLSFFILREPITRLKIVALGIALLGTTLTVGPEGGQLLGIFLAISAALIYSLYIIVGSQVMKQVSAVQSSTVIFASAGLMSGALMFINRPQLPQTNSGWWAIAAIVIVATVIPVVTFLAGLERVGPSNAAMLSTLEPVVTVILAALFLNESPNPITLVGGGLILVAVVMLAQSELRHPIDQSASL